MSFILMKRLSFWCPIKKRKEIIMSMFGPIDKWTLTLKKGGKKSFSYETEAPVSFILMTRKSFWHPIMKRQEFIIWIRLCPSWRTNFDYKKWRKEKLLLWNQSINVIYPNKENEFKVPNQEKKWNYYKNPCLSPLKVEF